MGRDESDARQLLAAQNPEFDPRQVGIDDAAVLDLLDPVVREWWVEQFADAVPEHGGFFTPPQKEAIPLIHEGENALVCAPTGSGKCVTPDTPLVVRENGTARVIRAEDLLERRNGKVADVDEDGELHDSDVEAFSLSDGDIEHRKSFVYSESYTGDLRRIETVYGREVEVTPDHPLLVERADGPTWTRAEEIAEGDRIGVPAEIDLPSREVEPNVDEALAAIRDRFAMVLTPDEAEGVISTLLTAEDIESVPGADRRKALALAGLSIDEAAAKLSTRPASVRDLAAGRRSHESDPFLELLREAVVPLGPHHVLVETDDGQLSRFRYPLEIDENVARFCAFVLAAGVVGDCEEGTYLALSAPKRTDRLNRMRRIANERFGVQFRRKNERTYVVADPAFAVFLSELLDLTPGTDRTGRFPDWVLNAPAEVKRAFLSTFLSLEGEVRENEVGENEVGENEVGENEVGENEVGVVVSNEMTIEQLGYLLLSFGILPARRQGPKCGRKTDDQGRREYYELTVRGKPNLRKLLSTFDVGHATFDEPNRYADGGTAGTLVDTAEGVRPRTVAWLEVEETETVPYDGPTIDLSVPDTHNFVGGRGGIYLHNTLASFTSIVDELFRTDRTGGLDNSVYCLYVSPLKSLANDIHRNLEVPLEEITDKLSARGEDVELRHAIRHGDTDDSDRQRMLAETPHILNTTPETLAILLNSPRFKEKLETVEYVIVDEIHALADNKRGTHLAVSLERLEEMTGGSPTRIGCSATVEPLETMAEFLVGRQSPAGPPRDYEIVDARFVRDFDVRLSCPTDDLITTTQDVVHERFYDHLHELVRDATNTLVFTNTRSGAERVLHDLRDRYDRYDEDNSACHHGSLSKAKRQDVEQRLKDGDVEVVTTSTSLELGIDMPYLDLVVQVGSPKSVAALLQRVGRAGHRLGETVRGRVIALDRDELIECAVMLQKAEAGFVDRVFVPENAHDVAAQHVYGMAINEVRPEAAVRAVLRRAYPYREYAGEDFEQLFRYLTADYDGLEDRNVYAKVWRDTNDPPGGEYHYEEFEPGTPLVGKRGRLARVIYMTNLGTIPDSFDCGVFTRSGDERVGQLDESYLDTLETGDVFVLGGDRFEYRYRRGSKVYVDRTSARPTVPSWYSERLPLSYDLGREILDFQADLLDRLESGGPTAVRRWLREFPLDENSVRAIARMFDTQTRYAGRASVSTDDRLAIEVELDREAYRRRYYVHSNYGRRFNDGLSRLLAYRCARQSDTNVTVAVADNGFTLSMPLNRKVDLTGVLGDVEPGDVGEDLRAALAGTDLLKRYFRINATRALMILTRYKGTEKSASRLQVDSEMLLGLARDLEDFAVMEETYREILEDRLNVAGIEAVVGAIQAGDIDVTSNLVESPTPRAFGLATLTASDVVLAEDETSALRAFHQRVLAEIDDDGGSDHLRVGEEW